jgi:hypothetical protein
MRIFEDTVVLNFTAFNQPSKIFCIRFKSISDEGQSLEQLLDATNLEVNLLE